MKARFLEALFIRFFTIAVQSRCAPQPQRKSALGH
jgi:hypothetical protein